MKPILMLLLLLTYPNAYAIGNCYVYSDQPEAQAKCEREYIYQHQEWKNQEESFNQIINQTTQSQQNAQQADNAATQQNQLNELLKLLNQS